PLTPGEKQVRSLSFRIQSATLRGPMDRRHWVRPPGYDRFFPGAIPGDADGRRAYTRDLLGRFAARAFRRPVDEATKDRLTALAGAAGAREGQPLGAGGPGGRGAPLPPPRSLSREGAVERGAPGRSPPVDEYSLASRLSYFLWSSMPDDELIRLAAWHRLR